MPHIYSYARLAAGHPPAGPLSQDSQERLAVKRGNDLIHQNKGFSWAPHRSKRSDHIGGFVDCAESSEKIKFYIRPIAIALLSKMERGDVLVVSRLCRCCRNANDFFELVSRLDDRGIRLVVVAEDYDTGSEDGRLAVNICRAIYRFSLNGNNKWAAPKVAPQILQDPRPSSDVGRVHIYSRNVEEGTMIATTAMLKWSEKLCHISENLQLGELYHDTGAYSDIRFLKFRPNGKRLCNAAKRGDHVVFWSLESMWLHPADMMSQLAQWYEEGIACHCLTDNIDFSEDVGRRISELAASFAEVDKTLKLQASSQKLRCMVAVAKQAGVISTAAFWRSYSHGPTRKLLLDRYQLVTFRYLILATSKGVTLAKAVVKLENLIAKREHRQPLSQAGSALLRSTDIKPIHYRVAKNGLYLPLWTVNRYKSARKTYDFALDLWRSQDAATKLRLR